MPEPDPIPPPGSFSAFLGVRFEGPSEDGAMRATVPLRPELHQPMGITHGGIYAA